MSPGERYGVALGSCGLVPKNGATVGKAAGGIGSCSGGGKYSASCSEASTDHDMFSQARRLGLSVI